MEIIELPNVYNQYNIDTKLLFNNPVTLQEHIVGLRVAFYKKDDISYIVSDEERPNYSSNLDALKILNDFVDDADLQDGWIYHCVYRDTSGPYGRVPEKKLVLLDIQRKAFGQFISPVFVEREGERLGLQVAPVFFNEKKITLETAEGITEGVADSMLGGKLIATLVKTIQNNRMGVCTIFKSSVSNSKDAKHISDKIEALINNYKNIELWETALKELDDKLTGDPADLGMLIERIRNLTNQKYKEEIKEKLFELYWPTIAKHTTSGIAEWFLKEVQK